MICIKMGSDKSHFTVSLIVRDKVTRQCPQTTTFEVVSNRGPSAYRLPVGPNRLSTFCLVLLSGSPFRWVTELRHTGGSLAPLSVTRPFSVTRALSVTRPFSVAHPFSMTQPFSMAQPFSVVQAFSMAQPFSMTTVALLYSTTLLSGIALLGGTGTALLGETPCQ